MRRVFFAFFLLSGFLFTGPAFSQASPDKDSPVLFKADEVQHERDLSLVIARGNVEIVQDARILRADTVTYNQKDDLVTATGNVSILEPDGNVVFAEHAQVTGDLKRGVVTNIRVLLADNSRAVAASGVLSGGTVTNMRRGVYSPCRTCVGTKGTPLWQIKAYRITHNKKDKVVEYRDAFMEFMGLPIMYTPYLSHPDPTVKRQSGFLPASAGVDSDLGLFFRIPYFWVIDRDKDATITLMETLKEGPALLAEYRQRFSKGTLEVDASGTIADIKPKVSTQNLDEGENEFRGHLKTDFDYHIDPTWRSGLNVHVTSDDTYLQRYKIDNRNLLENVAFVEGFRGNNYAAAHAYAWQDLRAGNRQGQMPIIHPTINYNYVGPTTPYGGRFLADANLLLLTRTGGTDSRRLSLKSGWEQRGMTSGGHSLLAHATLQTDLYHASRVTIPGRAATDTTDGVSGRIFPRAGFDWRYPLALSRPDATYTIEPVAGIMLSPNGGNPEEIPNEDSQVFEFDDTNILSRNLFAGRDRVEGGQRLYYGAELGVYGRQGYSSAFFGQSYRLRNNDAILANTGLDDHFSDYVGRVLIRPKLPVETVYRFHIDKDDLSFKRNSLFFKAGPPALNFSLNYDFFDLSSSGGQFPNREEVSAGFSSQISRDWAISGNTRRDIINGFTSSQSINVVYTCDCFTMQISFTRSFVQDREIEPTDTVFVRFIFKNLGEFATGTSFGGPDTE